MSGNSKQLVTLLTQKRRVLEEQLNQFEESEDNKEFSIQIKKILKEIEENNESEWFIQSFQEKVDQTKEFLGENEEQIEAIIQFCRECIEVLQCNLSREEYVEPRTGFEPNLNFKASKEKSGKENRKKLIRSISPDFKARIEFKGKENVSKFGNAKPNSRKQEILEKRKAAMKKAKGGFGLKNKAKKKE